MESSLREFPNIKPLNFWFDYPIHKLDISGELGDSPAQGTPEAGRLRNGCSKTTKDAENEFRKAFDILNFDGSVKVTDIIDYLNLSDKTVYRRLRSMRDEFRLEKGHVYRCDNAQKTDS